jgi:hypothetical protein
MIQVTPKEFVETMQLMETRYGAKDFIPVSSKSTLSLKLMPFIAVAMTDTKRSLRSWKLMVQMA